MFEARISQGSLLKKLIDALKDLVDNGNFDCSRQGFGLQALDSAHVALVSLMLHSDSFAHFRCDRNISLGINLKRLADTLKAANDTDVVTMQARSLSAESQVCLSEVELSGARVTCRRTPQRPPAQDAPSAVLAS